MLKNSNIIEIAWKMTKVPSKAMTFLPMVVLWLVIIVITTDDDILKAFDSVMINQIDSNRLQAE